MIVVLRVRFNGRCGCWILAFFGGLLRSMRILLILILSYHVLTIHVKVTIRGILFVTIVRFATSCCFHLVTLVNFLRRRPRFINAAGTACAIDRNTFVTLKWGREAEDHLILNYLVCCCIPFLFFRHAIR